ncbi:MAG: PmeII family type II restriction endonuclease [Phototrophicales bacterium]|nr:PmeII family type II restriction endonuclease [Phototrophicales bacterium]
MNPLNLDDVYEFVNIRISQFHQRRLSIIKEIDLKNLVKRKNPYLFRAKNITLAQNYVAHILESSLASQEETMFGEFLEALAIFIASKTYNGYKSHLEGVDLELKKAGVYYLVQIKSGINWGNSSQHKQIKTDFEKAKPLIQSNNLDFEIQPVIGSCYGKARTTTTKQGIIKLCGQSFWHFISDDPDLYTKIVEPIGYEAKKHNEDFSDARDNLINQLNLSFIQQFCLPNGAIDWEKLIQFNSKNLVSPT